MNSYLTRTTLAVSSVLLVTGCGTAGDVDTAGSAPREQVQAVAGGTYDGWAVRARWDAPSLCPWSPDQIERMMESGRPLPGCVRRLQRWFAEQYDARR